MVPEPDAFREVRTADKLHRPEGTTSMKQSAIYAPIVLIGAISSVAGCSKAPEPPPPPTVQLVAEQAEVEPVAEPPAPRPITVSVDGYPAAFDQLKHELSAQLETSGVLLVWCVDQSESMLDDRQEIVSIMDAWYQDLSVARPAVKNPALTAVMSFGAAQTIHTPKPTADIAEIKAAIRNVPSDPSGVENTCQAIRHAILQCGKFAAATKRQMMVILVTDESGDPADHTAFLEPMIAEAKAAGTRIYVLGPEAVFGYPYSHVRWIDPSTRLTFWLQMDRGPETCQPELLQIDGLQRRSDSHLSGFGPFSLTRITRETRGTYYMLPNVEREIVGAGVPDRQALERYQPDLCSASEYVAQREKSELRRAVWKVISDLNPHIPNSSAEVRMNRFSLDRDEFARQSAESLQKARQLMAYLSKAQTTLDKLESQRDAEPSLRWRANFDLIRAQVVAYQVRLNEYGLLLEEARQKPRPVKNSLSAARPTTHWQIHLGRKTLRSDQLKTQQALANERFQKVISEHAGTPYAERANHELKAGFGVDLHEASDDSKTRATVTVPKF